MTPNTSRRILRYLRALREGNPLGLTPDALAILLSLADHPDGKPLARIRDSQRIPKAASLYSSSVLADNGLIDRTNKTTHTLGLMRQNSHLSLTPAGRRYLSEILANASDLTADSPTPKK